MPEILTPGAPPAAPSAGTRSTTRFSARLRRVPRRALLRSLLLVLLVLAGGLVALLVDLPSVGAVRSWLDGSGPVGWLGLLAAMSLITLAPVPRTAVSVLAGVIAGFWGGLALALGSGVLGALVGFGLARWLGRETVTRLAGPALARADALLSRRGAVAVLSGRLIPVVPFTLVSYAGGLSGMRVTSYLLGSAAGLVPGTLLHVTVGATVGAEGLSGGRLLLSLVPLVLGIGVLGGLAWWRRRSTRPSDDSATVV
jgi:uncharacterized membrane protein YdjX (TVP38/TMEM64 family)